MNFDGTWQRIIEHSGEIFCAVRNLEFTYELIEDCMLPYRDGNFVGRKIHRNDFQYVFDNGPYTGPGDINQLVQGPSFVWAILNDTRIIG